MSKVNKIPPLTPIVNLGSTEYSKSPVPLSRRLLSGLRDATAFIGAKTINKILLGERNPLIWKLTRNRQSERRGRWNICSPNQLLRK